MTIKPVAVGASTIPDITTLPFKETFPPPQRSKSRGSGRLLLGIAGALCVGVGLVSLRYLLPTIPSPAPLPNITLNRNALIVHAGFAAAALLLVPVQLWTGSRKRIGTTHRASGYIAVLAIYTAACSAYWLAPNVRGGTIAGVGFVSLATAWIITLSKGIIAARQRDFAAHRRWMIRVSSLTFAAVTLRLWLMLSIANGIDYDAAYRVIAWLCWIPNLLVAETGLVQESRRGEALVANGSIRRRRADIR